MFGWLRDFRGKREIEKLLFELEAEEQAAEAAGQALADEQSLTWGLRCLMEEKVLPLLEGLESSEALDLRVRVDLKAALAALVEQRGGEELGSPYEDVL